MTIIILAVITEFIFSLALTATNIYCFIKKKYLYLFIPCMIYLPPYYGFDVPGPFPVISVARVMYLVFFLYAFLNRRLPLLPNHQKAKDIPKEYYFVFAYFLLRIITNLRYAPLYSSAIKTIFSIIFENALLLYALYLIAPTKEEIFKLVKVLVNVSAFMFFMGVLESFTNFRVFDALYTVSTDIFNDHYYRMGYLRATTTLCMPNYFSNICLFVTPLIFYMHKVTNQKRYLLFIILDILALIHAGSRSSMFFFLAISMLYFTINLLDKNHTKIILKSSLIIIMAITAWTILVSSISPQAKYFYSGTGKSLLNMVGFNFDLNEGAPDGAKYGENADNPTYSRLHQISGIKNSLDKNLFFGLGSGCLEREEIIYEYKGRIVAAKAIDSAPVEILPAEGIIGFIGYILLFFGLLFTFIKRHFNPITNNYQQVITLISLAYIVSMLTTANMYNCLMLIVFFFYYSNSTSNTISS